MQRHVARLVLVATVLLAAGPARGWTFEFGEHTRLSVMALLQVQAQFAEGAAPDKTAWSKDFYLRRARIILAGDVWKGISFFLDTEQGNFGKGGNWDVAFFLSDAFMTFKAVDEFMVDVGMMLLPFSRHGIQSAPGLNGLDFHLGVLRLADGSHKNLRDAGVQIRGYVAARKLHYRLGVFSGTQGTVLQRDATGAPVKGADGKAVLVSGPEDWPRFAGHVRYAILGTEPDFFMKGITFGSEPVVSFGAGFDYQAAAVLNTPADVDREGKVTTPGTLTHAVAATADVFLDWPFGREKEHEVVVMGAFYWYDHGNELSYDAAGRRSVVPSRNSGTAVLAELGYRYTFFEPVLTVDWFRGRQADTDLLVVKGGLNFWLRKAAANLKTEFGAEKRGHLSRAPWQMVFTTQAQVFF